jgi:hypothetical protein
MSPPRPTSQLELLRARHFGPLFWTQFLGALNDNLFKTAFIFIINYGVLSETHDGARWTPMLNGLLILPFLLFSALAGQIADKLEKSKLIRWIKLWEVAVMVVAAIGFLTHDAWLLAGTLFLMGTQSAFFGPVKYSILPQTLGAESLISANALIGTATFLAILVGSMGGGLLMKTGFASTITAVLLLTIALAGMAASWRIPRVPASDPALRIDWNPFRQVLGVCRDAAKDPLVWRSVLGVSWFWFFGATLLTLFPTYGKNILHVNEQVVTLFLMVFCAGIGLGAMTCSLVARHRLELGVVPAGAVGLSAFAIDLFFASFAHESTAGLAGVTTFLASAGSIRIVVDLLGLAFCGGLYVVPLNTLVQTRAPVHKRSRVLAANGIVSALFMVVSAAMTLLFAALAIPSVLTYLVLALMNLAVVVYIFNQGPEMFLRVAVFTVVRVVYRLRVDGLEYVPKTGRVVLAANHVTYVDALILSAALARPIRFVMYHEFAELPLVGRFLKLARVIPIASGRENPELLSRALDDIARALHDDEAVCIFPEGTLTDDGEINAFRRGIERIVARTPAPVIPLGLRGLWGSLFSRARKRFRLWTKIQVRVGPPIAVGDVTAERVRDRVAALV